MVYLGSSIFKITRLLVIAVSSVHFFACIFHKVKEVSAATEEDIASFYVSRNVDEKVLPAHAQSIFLLAFSFVIRLLLIPVRTSKEREAGL